MGALQPVEQNAAMAELLLKFECIDVGEAQLHGGAVGSARKDCLKRREVSGHAGGCQEDIVFGAVIEAGELSLQRPADGRVFTPGGAAGQVRFRLPGRDDDAGMLPERMQSGLAGYAGHDAMYPSLCADAGTVASGAPDELCAHPRRAARRERKTGLSIADLAG
jgi:hypothetical protein